MTTITPPPSGWARAHIEDLFAPLHDGRTLHQGWSPQCDHGAAGEDEWGVLKTTAIQPGAFLDHHNKRLPDELAARPGIEVSPGDILITCAGPRSRCGVPALVRHTRAKLMMSGKMYRFRLSGETMSAAFMEAQLLSSDAQAAINRMKTGGSDSGLNLTHERFRQLPVVVAPLAEQSRIADEVDSYLSRLDAAVANLERAQAKLKAYRASVLKAAVEARLVPTEAESARKEKRTYEPASELLARILVERRRRWEDAELVKLTAAGKAPRDEKWKAKYEEPAAPNASGLPELPEGWCWASVSQGSTKVVDGVHKKPSYVAEGVPFVTVRNLTAGRGIDFSRLNRITASDHAEFSRRANVERDDVLISKDGTLGVVRRVDTDVAFSIFVSVALIKPVLREMSHYLAVALASPQVQKQMVPKGSGLVHIHLEDLRQDCIPIPPLAEQARIVAEVDRLLSVADDLERSFAAHLIRTQRLRQAILKWAFEGKLVDQDPNDEPAADLLARIRAERATANDTKATRGRKAKVTK